MRISWIWKFFLLRAHYRHCCDQETGRWQVFRQGL